MQIITERALCDTPTWRSIIRDIAGPNIRNRNKALAGLRFMLSPGETTLLRRRPYCRLAYSFSIIDRPSMKNGAVISSPHTCEAIVKCLCVLIPEAAVLERDPPIESAYRTQPERNALWILNHIVPAQTANAIKAGLISKWLVDYPFGGAGTPPRRRKEIMYGICKGTESYKDVQYYHLVQQILCRILNFSDFADEVDTCGLLNEDSKPNPPLFNSGEIRGALAEEDMGVAAASDDQGADGRARRQGESGEEQTRRRRRREAVVIGENGRPIRSQDIIQRDPATLQREWNDPDESQSQSVTGANITERESRVSDSWAAWIRRLRPDGLAPIIR